jgi:hypothetical protein
MILSFHHDAFVIAKNRPKSAGLKRPKPSAIWLVADAADSRNCSRR